MNCRTRGNSAIATMSTMSRDSTNAYQCYLVAIVVGDVVTDTRLLCVLTSALLMRKGLSLYDGYQHRRPTIFSSLPRLCILNPNIGALPHD